MTGQDIVNVRVLAERVGLTALSSKLDGGARGGGALSVREVGPASLSLVSIRKPDHLRFFDRMAKRTLVWAMLSSIVEKAQAADEKQVEDADACEGFTTWMTCQSENQIRKMGGLCKAYWCLPGGDRMTVQQAVTSSSGKIEAHLVP